MGSTERRIRRKRAYSLVVEDEEEEVDDKDRISNLPDHVIWKILSCLRTEEAVQTSVLCSRWRYLWHGVTSVDLWFSDYKVDMFSNLVDHVLKNCTSTHLSEFRLSCPLSVDKSRLNGWVRSALSLNIEKLSVGVRENNWDLPKPPFPKCILTCSTLSAVELDSCFDFEIPEQVVCFPCLKLLRLVIISPCHDLAMLSLLRCCPALEELRVSGYLDTFDARTIDITVPSLKSLTLLLHDDWYATLNNYTFVINTPNLEHLSIRDNSLSCYALKNLHCVRDVHVNYESIFGSIIEHEHRARLLKMLEGIGAAELLELRSNTINVLETVPTCDWPIFPRLVMLTMHKSSFSIWKCLARVLHSAPRLEVLILDLRNMNDFDERQQANNYFLDLSGSIPCCLLAHLKRIGVKSFEGNKDDLQVVQYLLENSKVLDVMMIGFDPYPIDGEVVEKLFSYQRASKTCDIQVREYIWVQTDFTTSRIKITLCGS